MRYGMQDALLMVSISLMLLISGCAFMDTAETPIYNDSQNGKLATEDKEIDQAALDNGRMNTVRTITFEGNKAFKEKVLRQRIGFKEDDYLYSGLAKEGGEIITDIYREIGFAFVNVRWDEEKLSEGKVVYTIDEGPRVKIRKVTFIGNDNIKSRKLSKAIKTKKKKWFYWPFYYNEKMVAEDKNKLENLYYERGFLDCGISAGSDFTDSNGATDVTFIIDEGPIYRVSENIVVGNEYFDEEALRSKLQLEPGQVYIKRKVESDVKELLKLYRERGFINVKIQQEPILAEQKPKDVLEVNIPVEFEITEGEQFRIGRIDIMSTKFMPNKAISSIDISDSEFIEEFIQDKAVRRVLDEYGFRSGKLYNADIAPQQGRGKLEEYVQRKMYAEQVSIRPEGMPKPYTDDFNEPNVLGQDVAVGIEEVKTGLLQPGIGVSSDSGIIGSLVFDQRNFDINDWPESFKEFITMDAFKGAGQRMRISLAPGTEVSVYSVDFSNPYWRDRPTKLDLQGSKYKRFRESFDEGRLRSFIGFEQRRENRWRRSATFRVENINVGDIDLDAPQEIRGVKGDNSLFGVELGIARDMTDDEFRPSRGYTFNIDYEQAAGDHTFGKTGGKYIWYKTLYEDLLERKTVLATKLQVSTTVGDAPPFEKYYAGGSYSIRGFEYRGVSTRGLQTNVTNPQRKDPIGSDWLFLANTEVTVPLIGDNIAALFFVDSGAIDSGSYRAAAGVGIQIMIPWLGQVPMRFELATPIMKDDYDETQVFSFSIGGKLF
jgi:outer membrane protein insertion porin family